MDDLTIFAIAGVGVLVACAAVWSFLSGPRSPFADNWRKQARELEVEIRMSGGEKVINDLRAVAKLYFKLGKRWDAEQALRRAWRMSEQHWGQNNERLVPVMEDFARLMDGMHRRREATEVRKQITKMKNEQTG